MDHPEERNLLSVEKEMHLAQDRDWRIMKHWALSFARCPSPQTQQTPCLRLLGQGSVLHVPKLQLRQGTSTHFEVPVEDGGTTCFKEDRGGSEEEP